MRFLFVESLHGVNIDIMLELFQSDVKFFEKVKFIVLILRKKSSDFHRLNKYFTFTFSCTTLL